MPSFERGVYEPPNDEIRVFDDEEQDVDEEGSRLPLLIVIALLVLAAFGGVVYLAWAQGVQRGRADAPRMIVAAPGPVKEAAADSGAQTHSLKIYEQPAPADDSSDDSTPPAAEAAKPAAVPTVIAPPPAAPKPAPVVAEVPKPASPVAAAPKPETAAPKPATVVEKPATKAAPVVKQAAAPEVSSAPPKPLVAATKPAAPATAPKSDAATVAKTEAPSAPKPEAAASSGAYELQIGAYKSQDEADAAWKAYKFKHPSAAGYSEDVHKADLGDKGIWYRLRIGPFSDKAGANDACDKLKADGGACMLAR